jgi:hypothetical protein
MLDLPPHKHSLTYCAIDTFRERKIVANNWQTVRMVLRIIKPVRKYQGNPACRTYPTGLFTWLRELSKYVKTDSKGISAWLVETIALAENVSITNSKVNCGSKSVLLPILKRLGSD